MLITDVVSESGDFEKRYVTDFVYGQHSFEFKTADVEGFLKSRGIQEVFLCD